VCSPPQDAQGRWTLKDTPTNLHSVTQPLSATNTLGSSVHLATKGPTHDEGDFNPVVAYHSYGDSSPVVASDDVIENTRYRSAQRSKVGAWE